MNSKDYECTAFAPKYMIDCPEEGQANYKTKGDG